jgi:hypothetical protein
MNLEWESLPTYFADFLYLASTFNDLTLFDNETGVQLLNYQVCLAGKGGYVMFWLEGIGKVAKFVEQAEPPIPWSHLQGLLPKVVLCFVHRWHTMCIRGYESGLDS